MRAPRLLFLLSLLIAACPPVADQSQSPPAARCVKHGEKCRVPSGPLGVCDTIRCPPGDPGPCFKCMPQH